MDRHALARASGLAVGARRRHARPRASPGAWAVHQPRLGVVRRGHGGRACCSARSLSFALPLGAEADHGHDHGAATRRAERRARPRRPTAHHSPGALAADRRRGGVAASGVVRARPSCCRPPRSRPSSRCRATPAHRRCSRGGCRDPRRDRRHGVVRRRRLGDGVRDGDRTRTPSTATRSRSPASSRPGDDGDGFDLTRLVITHCVIDAQPASVPVAAPGPRPRRASG